MSAPAPLLRPPIPGSRNNSGTRTPRLGLAIPPSPSARPLNPPSNISEIAPLGGAAPPALNVATPMGSNVQPQESKQHSRQGRLPPLKTGPGLSAGGSSDSAHSRSGSFGDNQANGSTSTTSIQSLLNLSDPLSAAGSLYSAGGGSESSTAMERESSIPVLPDLEKLSLEKGRALDVEDLDDAGWRVASKENKIRELGGLGEGAGGAVTRCILKGGKTVFALKVRIQTRASVAPYHTDNHA